MNHQIPQEDPVGGQPQPQPPPGPDSSNSASQPYPGPAQQGWTQPGSVPPPTNPAPYQQPTAFGGQGYGPPQPNSYSQPDSTTPQSYGAQFQPHYPQPTAPTNQPYGVPSGSIPPPGGQPAPAYPGPSQAPYPPYPSPGPGVGAAAGPASPAAYPYPGQQGVPGPDPRLPANPSGPVIGRPHPSRATMRVVTIVLISLSLVAHLFEQLRAVVYGGSTAPIPGLIVLVFLILGLVRAIKSLQTSVGWLIVFSLIGSLFYTMGNIFEGTMLTGGLMVFPLIAMGVAIAVIDYLQFKPCAGQREYKPIAVSVLTGYLLSASLMVYWGIVEPLLSMIRFGLTADLLNRLILLAIGILAVVCLVLMKKRESSPVLGIIPPILLSAIGGLFFLDFITTLIRFSVFGSGLPSIGIAKILNVLIHVITPLALAWLPDTRRWFAS